MRQQDRPHPSLTVEIDGVIQPDRPERRVEIILTTARQEPDAAVLVRDDTAEIIVGVRGFIDFGFLALSAINGLRRTHRKVLAFGTRLGIDECVRRRGDWLHPLFIREDAQADLTALIQADAVLIIIGTPILTPGGATLLPANPEMVLSVVSQRWPGLIEPRITDRAGGRRLTGGGIRPQPDVVVALVISVPCDANLAVLGGRDRRRPTAALLSADAHLGRPGRTRLATSQHAEDAVTHPLPRDPDLPLRIGRRHWADVVCLVLGKVDRCGESTVSIRAGPDFEVRHGFHLLPGLVLAPENPEAAGTVQSQGGLIDVAAIRGHRNGEGLVLPFNAEHQTIATGKLGQVTKIGRSGSHRLGALIAIQSRCEARVNRIDGTVSGHGDSRIVVIGPGLGDLRSGGDTFDFNRTSLLGQHMIVRDLAKPEGHLALR